MSDLDLSIIQEAKGFVKPFCRFFCCFLRIFPRLLLFFAEYATLRKTTGEK